MVFQIAIDEEKEIVAVIEAETEQIPEAGDEEGGDDELADIFEAEMKKKEMEEEKKRKKKKKVPKLIDNVFADLENMFYLLSDLVYHVMWREVKRCCDVLVNMLRVIAWFVVYPLIFAAAMVVVLPSCILLLVVRMSKIESDTKQVAIRQMFGVLTVYPLIIVYLIIPRFGHSGTASYLISAIGSYLFLILIWHCRYLAPIAV